MVKAIQWPVTRGSRVTQFFAENPAMYQPFGLLGHNGIDFGVVTGTPITAVGGGTVMETRLDRTGYGRHVRIQHDGYLAIYAHLSRTDVVVGQIVFPGQVIGLSGGDRSDPYAGNSTGAHLHFEIRPAEGGSPGFGGAVDPWPWLMAGDAEPPAGAVWQGTVLASKGLNVRSTPMVTDDNSNLLYTLNHNAVVWVSEVSNGWAKLVSSRDEWVSADWLRMELVGEVPEPEPEPVTLEDRVANIERILTQHGWM
jgi:murein DD-endopeptidase MepM/ murein hydrolase activator NlpD